MTNPCGLTFALALFVVFVFHFSIEACFFIFTLGVFARRKRVRKREYYDEKTTYFLTTAVSKRAPNLLCRAGSLFIRVLSS
jgi:hypothetical protein